jgi:FAD/FMN-containing dehydrogenase
MERRPVLRAVLGVTKRVGICLLTFVVVLGCAATVAVWVSGDDEFAYSRPPTLVNDITQMNPTYVARVVQPASIDEVVDALRTSSGPVSIGGGRFSQGGQVSYPDSLHLDMRKLNRVVNLDVAHKRITVESGITWRKIQGVITIYRFASCRPTPISR